MITTPTQEGKVKVKVSEKYRALYKLPAGTNVVVLIGGRGGGKTYEASKYVAFSSTIKKKRCVVLRDEAALVRESILNEILLRYDTANGEDKILDQNFIRMDTGIKSRETSEMMVFTKGFRASQGNKTSNLKSISNVDIAVIEEAEDIRDVNKFNTFADSIRKEGSLIIIILNTPDIQHWIIQRYFTWENVPGEDGYYKLVPKTIPGFFCIQSSFEDNAHNLPKHIVDNYRNYGVPGHHLYNKHYYLTAILGYASAGRKGQVFTKVKKISLKDYLALPYREYFGQDFGTSSPAGTVGVKIHRNSIWTRELNYLPMNTLDIGKLYCRLKLSVADPVIADSADGMEKSISILQNGWKHKDLKENELMNFPTLARGFNVIAAKKRTIKFGIDLLDSMDWHMTEDSTNHWNEIVNYVYAQDKWGNYTNDPIDDFNHLNDPTRYVAIFIKYDNQPGSTAV